MYPAVFFSRTQCNCMTLFDYEIRKKKGKKTEDDEEKSDGRKGGICIYWISRTCSNQEDDSKDSLYSRTIDPTLS